MTDFDFDLFVIGGGSGGVRTDVVVEAAQDGVAAVDLGDLAAETVEDAGELRRDIAAADDDHALGQALDVENLVRGDGQTTAGLGSAPAGR